jgi:hypothetical protein
MTGPISIMEEKPGIQLTGNEEDEAYMAKASGMG